MPDYAILFPGQGSQSLRMMDAFAEHDIVRQTFQTAQRVLGVDLWNMLQEDSADNINHTINTQVLMLTSAYAIYQVYNQNGQLSPKFVAGHSLGEYTALVAAGVIEFEEALPLVLSRSKLMQSVGDRHDGMMAAVLGFTAMEVAVLCNQVSDAESQVNCANFNTANQTVVAGHRAAVLRLNDLVKSKGGKSIILPVSVPSHCILMRDIKDLLRQECSKIRFSRAKIPVVPNVSAVATADEQVLKELLIEQLDSPVQWFKTINYIRQQGVNTFIETGPGRVLTGLGKKILPAGHHLLIQDFIR